MNKLKTSEIASQRLLMWNQQGQKCALCNLPLLFTKSVLDHDHTTGAIRATLHSGCNSLLGKVENNHRRYGVPNLSAFLHGTSAYLQRHEVNRTDLLHPTFFTPDEKRVRTNTKARKKRAATKATA